MTKFLEKKKENVGDITKIVPDPYLESMREKIINIRKLLVLKISLLWYIR